MPSEELRHQGRRIRLKKSTVDPDFRGQTVLVTDPWDYVDLWLRRLDEDRARFYWQQARHFAEAARGLPPTSAPLLAYYSMLNAVKTLLEVHQQTYSEQHGIGGHREKKRRGLTAEIVEFTNKGVFGGLRSILGEQSSNSEKFNLKQLLYNLVWVHRAFALTYPGVAELFVAIWNPEFQRKSGSSETWLSFTVSPKDRHLVNGKKLPTEFEWDAGDSKDRTIRRKARFEWRDNDDFDANSTRLTSYHRKLRRQITYIHSSQWLWYLKRQVSNKDVVDHLPLIITFAAMHRLSELARYEPYLLANHLEANHNFLLNEFIHIALKQFTDEIAAEITGLDFMIPGTRF
jgi:hypothetical protein